MEIRSLKERLYRVRPGITLVELLMFTALMGMMGATIIPMLINSTESRQRQDAIALVEQNGAQVIQVLSQEIRSAERVLYPTPSGTGFVLVLQTGSGDTNPTLIALESGSLIMVKGRSRRILTSSLIGVTSFVVDNTSVSDELQSVTIGVRLRRVIRLHNPLSYEAYFDAVYNLYPDDVITGDDCNCPQPVCDSGSGTMLWYMCINNACTPFTDFECLYP